MGAGEDRRIVQLIEAAAQAFDRGQLADADRFLRQVEAEMPGNALLINEKARRKLVAGDPGGARDLVEHALKDGSEHPSLWITMASALRGLSRTHEAMAAIEKS